ncbi:endoplasmic reticulum membrane sensor NFE2L1-like [Oncorhynchus keta]|uniref:endoplasmic reticulum membrane sensor NFE2L1-like n=1 Tax=Oncorhynchus keta TaxID=8018 RepID=UPI0015F873AB|nr:endoplasmic reticulum membrane sensor NFE2L1-like [Oncorhynchus keta]
MVCLKKYFTEGLIQVAILLSLVGVRVDVGPYLPPWNEMILGPTSALTQTQFHNPHNQLDGQDLHPKSVDLDGFFTARRLLGWVRSLDCLRVPSSELETWLVRREPDALVVGAQGQPAPLEAGAGGLEDHAGDQVESVMRSSVVAGSQESGYGPIREDSLDTTAPLLRRSHEEEDEDLYEEDTDMLWQDHSDLGRHQRPEEELVGDTWREIWRDGGRSYDLANRELAQDLSDQFASLEAQSSMSFQECLRLLEDTFPFGEETELSDPVGVDRREAASGEDPTPVRELLLSPLLSHEEPSLDLEQQWHDILATMEPEDMDMDLGRDEMQSGSIQSSSLMDPVHQDVSLHQAILPGSSQDSYPFNSSFGGSVPLEDPLQPALLSQSSSGPDFDHNLTFGPSDLTDNTLPLTLNGTVGNPMPSIQSSLFLEEPILPSPLGSLLDDALLDEISFLDLALEEGFNPTQASQLEELDSDSGLSLNFSHSPASPSSSEASYSSSSSSSSSDSSVFSDEGAVGYSSDMEDIVMREEGAVGGYSPKVRKMCSYQKPGRFNNLPWLEQVGHDHTYNQPWATSPTQGKSHYSKTYEHDISDKLWGRDERRALAMKIPFSNDLIVNLPVEEFNELLTKHCLSEAQLNLIRDIRRRGKNKMAAQNCRRRKLDVLFELEEGVEGLYRHKARLLKQKAENLRSVREMKQRLSGLYQEVFSRLRDEQGRPLPATDYTLQFGNDGQVLLATRNGSASEQNRKPHNKQKSRKK